MNAWGNNSINQSIHHPISISPSVHHPVCPSGHLGGYEGPGAGNHWAHQPMKCITRNEPREEDEKTTGVLSTPLG